MLSSKLLPRLAHQVSTDAKLGCQGPHRFTSLHPHPHRQPQTTQASAAHARPRNERRSPSPHAPCGMKLGWNTLFIPTGYPQKSKQRNIFKVAVFYTHTHTQQKHTRKEVWWKHMSIWGPCPLLLEARNLTQDSVSVHLAFFICSASL